MSVSDFIDGQRDCRNGVPHKEGRGEDYDRGYKFEEFLQECRERKITELGMLI